MSISNYTGFWDGMFRKNYFDIILILNFYIMHNLKQIGLTCFKIVVAVWWMEKL